MANAICICGSRMSDVDYPSENVLAVFDGNRVFNCLKDSPETTLWDFYADYDADCGYMGLIFWYCTTCKRVYVYPPGVNVLPEKTYALSDSKNENSKVFEIAQNINEKMKEEKEKTPGKCERKNKNECQKIPISQIELPGLKEIFVFTDVQIDTITEENMNHLLKDFLNDPPHPFRFFMSDDESDVFAYNVETGTIDFHYTLEEEN